MQKIIEAIQSQQTYEKIRIIIQNNTRLLSDTTEQGNNLFHVCILMSRDDLIIKILNDIIIDIERQASDTCSACKLIATMHALLLKSNMKGLSALHIAAQKGLYALIHTVLISANDITLIGLALSHCNSEGENMQLITVKQMIASISEHGENSTSARNHMRILNLMLKVMEPNNQENIALNWYAQMQIQQKRIDDNILNLLIRMKYEDIESIIQEKDFDEEKTAHCALMLSDTLLMQDHNGHNTIHLMAMNPSPHILIKCIIRLSAYQLSIALQLKNNHGKGILQILYDHGHDKACIIQVIKYLKSHLSQSNCCPRVLMVFYNCLMECKDNIEKIEQLPFQALNELLSTLLRDYLKHYIHSIADGSLSTSNEQRKAAQILEEEQFAEHLTEKELQEILLHDSKNKNLKLRIALKKKQHGTTTSKTPIHLEPIHLEPIHLEPITTVTRNNTAYDMSSSKLQKILKQEWSYGELQCHTSTPFEGSGLSLFAKPGNLHAAENENHKKTCKNTKVDYTCETLDEISKEARDYHSQDDNVCMSNDYMK